ncbi:hypothetical protein [Neolewinella agarilytica]|uniref:hypothetical protein n=1 Tax=Neolewinella agarilytica TaxID=478744 RepID=UPI0011136149|nr:hypothetical protein [Neolewinella agarilytica]
MSNTSPLHLIHRPDHSIDAEDSNWPIFYALKKSDKAFIIVKRYLLNSKYKFPRSFAKGRWFGEAGWLVRAIFDSMEEEEIKLISEKRMKYFNQFIE